MTHSIYSHDFSEEGAISDTRLVRDGDLIWKFEPLYHYGTSTMGGKLISWWRSSRSAILVKGQDLRTGKLLLVTGARDGVW